MNEIYRTALPPGTRIEEYRIERVLGAGGFGTTYLAQDELLEMQVAIKEYLPADLAVRESDLSVNPRSEHEAELYAWGLKRFREEAQTLARFDHRNIVRVVRFLSAHKTAYMVMQYEEGESLREVLGRGALTEGELKELMLPLLDGLEVIHRAGVLHRDIKPGNIYIRRDGSPVLLDFGAARQAVGERSRSMTAVLTPPYAPIEQYGKTLPQGPWTDIYALGVVAYQALSAKLPPDATDRAMGEDELEPLWRLVPGRASPALLRGIEAALKPRAGDRPQSVGQWRGMLWPEALGISAPEDAARPAQDAADTPDTGDGAAPASRRIGRRKKLIIVGIIATVVLLVIAAASFFAIKMAEERELERQRVVLEQQREEQQKEEQRRQERARLEQQKAEEEKAVQQQIAEIRRRATEAMENAKKAQRDARDAQARAQIAAKNARTAQDAGQRSGRVPANGTGYGAAQYSGDHNGDHYEGQWQSGKRQGVGVYTWNDHAHYEGEWRDDIIAGLGIYYPANSSRRYEGQFGNGRENGVGVYIWGDGRLYQGQMRDDNHEGYGVWTAANGDQYFGEWHNDNENGYGVDVFAGGRRYEGQLADNQWEGRGVLTEKDGTVKAGVWKAGQWVRALTPEDR